MGRTKQNHRKSTGSKAPRYPRSSMAALTPKSPPAETSAASKKRKAAKESSSDKEEESEESEEDLNSGKPQVGQSNGPSLCLLDQREPGLAEDLPPDVPVPPMEKLYELARNNAIDTVSYIDQMYLEIQALKSQLAEEPGQISGLNEVQALRSEVLRLREENNRLLSENKALRNENTSMRSAIRDGQHC